MATRAETAELVQSEPRRACIYRGTVIKDAREQIREWKVEIVREDTSYLLTHVSFNGLHHSPNGFSWGYAGSGPADLALSILAHTMKDTWPDRRKAWPLHQQFKLDVIAALPIDQDFEISQLAVREWIARWQRVHADAEFIGGETQ